MSIETQEELDPGVTCISVDDDAVHGLPSARRLRHGELVKLEVAAEPVLLTA